jgi:hypothetical protein
VPGANPTRRWAVTDDERSIASDANQTLDITVAPTRIIEGVATAGPAGLPAQGATLEATPLIAGSSNVLRTLITPPRISPARASVSVDTSGKFTLVLDPGYYDFALKPAAASNFAWWILPTVHVVTADMPGQIGRIDPQLLYPVPLGGTITVTIPNKPPLPLRNATVQAYARTPLGDNVTQVGTARTDDMGRYQLALPPAFGSLP